MKNDRYRIACTFKPGTDTFQRVIRHVGAGDHNVALVDHGKVTFTSFPEEAAKLFVAAYFDHPDLIRLEVVRL